VTGMNFTAFVEVTKMSFAMFTKKWNS